MKYYQSEKLNELTEQILEMMPALKEFFSSDHNIESYSHFLNNYQSEGIYLERQKKFIEILRSKIERLFNVKEREKINILNDVDKGLKGAVVDHHGVINDPILFGINFVTDYTRMFDRKKNGDILTFATGNVPVNDYFHRRGFLLNDHRINIFSKDEKNKFVFALPPKNIQIIESLKKSHTLHLFSQSTQKFLQNVQDIISGIDLSGCKTLGDQLTKINFYLWPLLFENKIKDSVSNLISIEYDDVVIDYLVYTIKTDRESFISNFLFNEAIRDEALIFFEGKVGAWDKIKHKGTHFFWYYSDDSQQLRLNLIGNYLISEDGKVKIPWQEDEIIKQLEQRKLLPCMLLKFSLLIFYMGLRPLTGYGSANYISIMQRDVIEFLNNKSDESSRISRIKVNNLTTVPVVVKKENNAIKNYYAFDVMCDEGLNEDYLKNINQVPLKYFLASRLNDLYNYAYPLYGKGEKTNIVVQPEDYYDLLSEVFV
ncbi:MAG: hypothetical protein KW804_00610 [Candidatus Doudnabacteria bacterium]|nr:hypothetical protein [Candidatus Doudnabacteria bacterium]